jgi:hypothetical protein
MRKLIERINEAYGDAIILTNNLVPSTKSKISDNVFEIYNNVLATHGLVESANFCNSFTNEALYDCCVKDFGV